MFTCPSACRRTYPRPCLYEAPLPDVWGATRTYQRQHQLTNQHRRSTCKWERKLIHEKLRNAFIRLTFDVSRLNCFPADFFWFEEYFSVLSHYVNVQKIFLILLHCSPEGVPGALAQTGCGGGWWTNRRPEPPWINSGWFISSWQIPYYQTWLVSSCSYWGPVCFYSLQLKDVFFIPRKTSKQLIIPTKLLKLAPSV